jgi:hypothetical protein
MQFPYGRRVPMQERTTTDAIIAKCSTVPVFLLAGVGADLPHPVGVCGASMTGTDRPPEA